MIPLHTISVPSGVEKITSDMKPQRLRQAERFATLSRLRSLSLAARMRKPLPEGRYPAHPVFCFGNPRTILRVPATSETNSMDFILILVVTWTPKDGQTRGRLRPPPCQANRVEDAVFRGFDSFTCVFRSKARACPVLVTSGAQCPHGVESLQNRLCFQEFSQLQQPPRWRVDIRVPDWSCRSTTATRQPDSSLPPPRLESQSWSCHVGAATCHQTKCRRLMSGRFQDCSRPILQPSKSRVNDS